MIYLSPKVSLGTVNITSCVRAGYRVIYLLIRRFYTLCYSSQMPKQKKGTPSWVERGLNMIENTADVLVIDQRSSTNSGFDCDRSSCNGSDEGR